MMQKFVQAMVDHNIERGSVVNIASIVGKTGNIGQSNYASSKSGVESMTRVASKEFGKFNIRVNAILPGFIKSPMTDKVPEQLRQMFMQQCALKRFGQPEGRSGNIPNSQLVFFDLKKKNSFRYRNCGSNIVSSIGSQFFRERSINRGDWRMIIYGDLVHKKYIHNFSK